MRGPLYVLAVVASVALGATSIAVSGNGPPGTLTVTPTTVEAGQSVTISGTQCPPQNGQVNGSSDRAVQEEGMVTWTINGPQPSNTQIANGSVSNTMGNWTTGPVTIPVGTAPGTYHANAVCHYNTIVLEDSSSRGFNQNGFNTQYTYNPAPFQVVAPSPSPSPTPTPTPTEEPEEEPEAEPAKAVRAQPTFTG